MQLGKGKIRIKESSYPSRHPPTGYRHHWRDPTELQSQHPRSSLSPSSPASRPLSLAFRSALTALQPLRPPCLCIELMRQTRAARTISHLAQCTTPRTAPASPPHRSGPFLCPPPQGSHLLRSCLQDTCATAIFSIRALAPSTSSALERSGRRRTHLLCPHSGHTVRCRPRCAHCRVRWASLRR